MSEERGMKEQTISEMAQEMAHTTSEGLKKRIRKLYTFDELPAWQKDNELILSGYVRETNSVKECLRAMTYFNNESINIYTHLIPGVAYLVLFLIFADLVLAQLLPGLDAGEHRMLRFYLLGAFTCLACSSCFHCLKQHSEPHSRLWSKVDYLGILAQITCSTISLLYYGYHSYPSHFVFFSTLTVALCSACAVLVLNDSFNTVAFRPLRAFLFMAFGLSGVIPVLAGSYQFGFAEWAARIQLKYVLYEAVFYITGALVYGFRIPERFAPGKFDMVGHSHQIFHLLVVLGTLCHFRAVTGSYIFICTGKHYSSLLMFI
ncbi:AFR337Wp [Eremothecium gossypii ATCC 10895]|uniref:ADIPOR-like receptor IZH1 n=1 Tax=Eremothecium gossypii (strain ATCC 10895 / CBS 109.51 / FGSC 9923 / NRRL Y-1056) TaxID=284811 RepID=IZH1_EREGS|nr:AFR337Wp [Eremothecium gossypii ATCC 10895]Q753H5.1 RecName: Full=ADIPOR-like receptor IZH1 [Eremothecium gossypii ATCC 10895]AAS53708.1 AFR337Wp [Eremothecium gossypii ATCC 10895]AEY98021.1 FAFR337Wp [Eremothecium gossypii FDAG1]